MKDFVFTAKAPAKILLSGEYAVVYGMPAIAMAVNRFAVTEIQSREGLGILFHLCNLRTTFRVTMETLSRVRERVRAAYHRFLEGTHSIKEVVRAPGDIFQYVFLSLIEAGKIELARGMKISLYSSIPIGCGMGSSAATIVSFVRAMLQYFHIERGIDWIEKLLFEAERFYHGRSSGVDPYICLHGGCVRFQKNLAPIHLSLPASSFWVIHTGKPQQKTGECVAVVHDRWADSPIWNEFATVTQRLEAGLRHSQDLDLREAIRENQRLLEIIGVVPQKVRNFVKEVESLGGVAKISGAGAISGDAGGIAIALSPVSLEDLCRRYQYECFQLDGEQVGATVNCCQRTS